ncbi:MAG: hypothetical protein RLZZ606_915 [Actinomycetota bacterium]|jgi:uncharacterized protein (DUF305 family)
MKTVARASVVVMVLTLTGLGLSGCITINESTDRSSKHMDPNSHHGSSHSMVITNKKSFAEAMVPHHQQAIDISEFAKTNTSNPGILAMAEKIIGQQTPEIQKMAAWLEGKSFDNSMIMDGMLSGAQVAELKDSQGAEFDQLYVQYMVQHHEGAIAMAADALGIDDPELSEFANSIIKNQTAEIEELMALLNN